MIKTGSRLLGGLLLVASLVFGQTTTSVTGLVTDPSGAVVPNASIELNNVDNGSKRDTISDANGSYSVPQLTPGNYRITAKATGFSSAVVNNLRFLVNTPATVNIKLEVGTVSDTISISAESVQLIQWMLRWAIRLAPSRFSSCRLRRGMWRVCSLCSLV